MSDVIASVHEISQYVPLDPVQIEIWLREANELLESMTDVLHDINERRYAAEREYSRIKHTAMVAYAREGDNMTISRAKAEIDALEALEAWHATKAEYHYADDTRKALQMKINSMMNINKAVTTQYQSYRG